MTHLYKNKIRIQDITARVSGVSLKNTVKILQSLVIILNHLGEKELSKQLHNILVSSAQYDAHPAPLHSKPCSESVEQCEKVYKSLISQFGKAFLDDIKKLDTNIYEIKSSMYQSERYHVNKVINLFKDW